MAKKHNHTHESHELFWLWRLIEDIHSKLNTVSTKLNNIMAKQSEMAADMVAVTAQIAKIGTESAATLQKVADLQAVIDGLDNVTPELQAAFDSLKAQVTIVDDLIPDVPLAG